MAFGAFNFEHFTNENNNIYENCDNQLVTSLRNIRFDQMGQLNESGLFICYTFLT